MKTEHPPAFLFYVDDFVSDGKVEAMTTEEVGAYVLLLCKAWKESPPGSIPDDDYVLARWSRMPEEAWAKSRERVLAPFKMKGERWHQKRMAEEYRKFVVRKKRKKEVGIKAAKARWNQQVKCERIADAMPKNAISLSLSNKKEKERGRRAEASAILSFLNEAGGRTFKDTDGNLKEIKARLSDGYTSEDAKLVIKYTLTDEYFKKNPKYFNPITLFRSSNIDKYLQAAKVGTGTAAPPVKMISSDEALQRIADGKL